MGLFRKIFGSYSDRQIKKLKEIADEIEALAAKYKAMTNEELANVTSELRARPAAGGQQRARRLSAGSRPRRARRGPPWRAPRR